MQISRHWRLNANRYRLQGVRYENGDVSLQNRPMVTNTVEEQQTVVNTETLKRELTAA